MNQVAIRDWHIVKSPTPQTVEVWYGSFKRPDEPRQYEVKLARTTNRLPGSYQTLHLLMSREELISFRDALTSLLDGAPESET